MVTWGGFATRLGLFLITASLLSVGVALVSIISLVGSGQPILPTPARLFDFGAAWWLALAGLTGLGLTPIAMLLGCIGFAVRLRNLRTLLFSLGVLVVIALGAVMALFGA